GGGGVAGGQEDGAGLGGAAGQQRATEGAKARGQRAGAGGAGPRAESEAGEGLDVEPGVLEVEVALEPVHDLVRDPALVAQGDDRGALGLEQLAAGALVRHRAFLDRAVVAVIEAGAKPVLAELLRAPEPLGGGLAPRTFRPD